jgi:aryl-alcohol dehydrogenase-like predicted oxidoreductase
MEQNRLGNSGLKVPHLSLGTMTWGDTTDEEHAAIMLRAYLEAGGSLLDTAARAKRSSALSWANWCRGRK